MTKIGYWRVMGLSKAKALEKEYGLPIRKIVVDALNEHGSVEIAAETIGYSGRHMRCLIRRLGIQRSWK